ncbi:hypothetical protein [Streptomyces graminilatus]|uniref:hypothetical protein n=1 Tax=Streptomyces graminilatus TaxID=1464070 RepID=UPI0006E21A31|nr:hypothetical protein [Streptomyces graminilatus]
MADEDAPAEDSTLVDAQVLGVEMEYVDSLPGGKVVMGLEEKDNRFTWLVVRGAITPQARVELLAELNHAVSNGLWEQNWQPPQAG